MVFHTTSNIFCVRKGGSPLFPGFPLWLDPGGGGGNTLFIAKCKKAVKRTTYLGGVTRDRDAAVMHEQKRLTLFSL